MTTRNQQSSPHDNPLRRQLTQLYDVLSNKIAGGQRVDHQSLMPGADNPAEGMIPDSMSSQLGEIDWFSPGDWAGLGSDDALRFDLTSIPKPGGKGIEGDGMDFYRSGEAPDNYTNRYNSLYVARKDFVAEVAPQLNKLFGTSAGGVGYYRPPSSSDSEPGGRSSNSDHYSAGAADFYGTPEQLDALRNYLVDQPWVSFVRWRSESHGGESGTESGAHLHASFDLGWVAQNYFTGRTVPPVKAPSKAPTMPAATPPDLTLETPPAVREGTV